MPELLISQTHDSLYLMQEKSIYGHGAFDRDSVGCALLVWFECCLFLLQEKLWSGLKTFADSLSSSAAAVWHLQRVVCKKKVRGAFHESYCTSYTPTYQSTPRSPGTPFLYLCHEISNAMKFDSYSGEIITGIGCSEFEIYQSFRTTGRITTPSCGVIRMIAHTCVFCILNHVL